MTGPAQVLGIRVTAGVPITDIHRHRTRLSRVSVTSTSNSTHIVALRACGCIFHIECPDDAIAALVQVAFGALIVPFSWLRFVDRGRYQIQRANTAQSFSVHDFDGVVAHIEDADTLLWHLDKSLTIALQHRRPDLYFVHAAAVALAGGVGVLAAPPGTGKSTLTVALLERGFTYLSDELAPIDFGTRVVHRYAHAISLKSPPPEPLCLPPGTVPIGRRFHVPTSLIRGAVAGDEPLPLVAFIFPERSSEPAARCRRIGRSVAAIHLVANGLNALAHRNDGLDVAVTLAGLVPCFQINIRDLSAACAEIEAVMTELSRSSFAAPSTATADGATG